MPWVMAAMTAAQMLQGQQNAEAKRKVDAAGIRYSPWTKISQLPFTPNTEVSTAQQGYAGITGQMQNGKRAGLEDALLQAQTNRLNGNGAPTTPGGSFMNDPAFHQGGGDMANDLMVRGYDKNAGTRGGFKTYSNPSPWRY